MQHGLYSMVGWDKCPWVYHGSFLISWCGGWADRCGLYSQEDAATMSALREEIAALRAEADEERRLHAEIKGREDALTSRLQGLEVSEGSMATHSSRRSPVVCGLVLWPDMPP
jgi:hypothetical protein